MAKRQRNPRVVALEKMREAKRWLHDMTMVWAQSRTVYVPSADRQPGENVYQRDRLPAEYGENDPAQLRRLIDYMRGIRLRCAEVERIALDRLAELEATDGS